MRKALLSIIILVVVVVMSFFIIRSFKASALPPQVPEPPDFEEAPARVYGVTEPAEREVYISPPVSRRIVAVHVREGDTVRKGEVLLTLESSVEEAQLRLAQAKVQSRESQLAINKDTFDRNHGRYQKRAISEYEYIQSLLRFELDKSNLEVAKKEAELAETTLEQLTIRSPIDGLVYKFDLRLGETLPVGENLRIILGLSDLWVRASVEAFWMNRVKTGDFYDVYSAETKEYIGTGQVIYTAPYMGRRNFRTEDLQERFDTKFQEVVLSLTKVNGKVPIGLSVYIELIQD